MLRAVVAIVLIEMISIFINVMEIRRIYDISVTRDVEFQDRELTSSIGPLAIEIASGLLAKHGEYSK